MHFNIDSVLFGGAGEGGGRGRRGGREEETEEEGEEDRGTIFSE